MRIGVPKEIAANERRVALTPDAAAAVPSGGTPASTSQPSRPSTVRLTIVRRNDADCETAPCTARTAPHGTDATVSTSRRRVTSTWSRTGSAVVGIS